jgi:hypothetical protein
MHANKPHLQKNDEPPITMLRLPVILQATCGDLIPAQHTGCQLLLLLLMLLVSWCSVLQASQFGEHPAN